MRRLAAVLPLVIAACAPRAVTVEVTEQPIQNAFELPQAQEVAQESLVPASAAPQGTAGLDARAEEPAQRQAPNPRNFAGRWNALVGGQECNVVLTAGAPGADGARLMSASGCGGALEGASGWKLNDDNIEIVGAGGTLATLGEGAPGTLSGGGVTLTR